MQSGQKLLPLILLVGFLAVDGLLVVNPWLRLGLLETGALLTVVMIWRTARTQAAKFTYLAVVLISAASMAASEVLADRGSLDWSRAFLFTGICVKLAAVPLFFWLLKLADEVPALALGSIIAVVDMAAFGEFCAAAQAHPLALTPQSLWIYVAAGTSLAAALLMLTQRSLKRLLVLSTAEDVGFLLLGATSMNALGTQGALVAAATHAIAKALLFICLAAPESAGALETEPIALASALPGQRLRIPLRHAGHVGCAADTRLHRPLAALLNRVAHRHLAARGLHSLVNLLVDRLRAGAHAQLVGPSA